VYAPPIHSFAGLMWTYLRRGGGTNNLRLHQDHSDSEEDGREATAVQLE
jgi:hypothetical protein